MSLRAFDQKVFEIVCDSCGVKTSASLMPVEAELRASEGGWRPGKNPLLHQCPWCIEKGSTATKTAAPADQLAGRADARRITNTTTTTAGR